MYLNHGDDFLNELHCTAGFAGEEMTARTHTANILFFCLLQESSWSNGRWEWVEMEIEIASSFCQEIRNAISSSPWQTAGSWAQLLLSERAGECFIQPPPPPGSHLEAQSCKFLPLLEASGLVLRVCLLLMQKSSMGTGLYTEKCYFEPLMGDREITEQSA